MDGDASEDETARAASMTKYQTREIWNTSNDAAAHMMVSAVLNVHNIPRRPGFVLIPPPLPPSARRLLSGADCEHRQKAATDCVHMSFLQVVSLKIDFLYIKNPFRMKK